VVHVGRVGPEGSWACDRLAELGVDVTHVEQGDVPTGHANVHVDAAGENMIVLFPGANRAITAAQIGAALARAEAGDTFLLQNETNLTLEAAEMAKGRGLFVIYSAAPFEQGPAKAILPFVDLLVLNAVEADQLAMALGRRPEDLPVPNLLITRGADGATWHDHATGRVIAAKAIPVEPVDTTGAGDCLTGYLAALLDQGRSPADALRLGAGAAALKVTRHGTSEAIPDLSEVERFVAGTET